VVHAAPPPAPLDDGDDDDVPEFAMGEADENGETMTFLNDQLPGQRRDQTVGIHIVNSVDWLHYASCT
jgi:hypothetical protein